RSGLRPDHRREGPTAGSDGPGCVRGQQGRLRPAAGPLGAAGFCQAPAADPGGPGGAHLPKRADLPDGAAGDTGDDHG
ncbi:hypothetical protein LPJCHP_LPJCHP_00150, partial [Dysosmobacter welbionis]